MAKRKGPAWKCDPGNQVARWIAPSGREIGSVHRRTQYFGNAATWTCSGVPGEMATRTEAQAATEQAFVAVQERRLTWHRIRAEKLRAEAEANAQAIVDIAADLAEVLAARAVQS